jgi:putative phosphoribosyl transferase
MAIFADRIAAGRELARSLADWRHPDALVAGIPRGGIVVAAEVARALDLALVAVVVRKLGAPGQQEFAVGAIADDVRVLTEHAARPGIVTPAQLAAVESSERDELRRRSDLFGGAGSVVGRTVLVVDDGVATGSTAMAACRSLRARGAGEIVLAVPVAPAEWMPDADAVDAYVCPHRMRGFWAVGEFYENFAQTSDAEVVELLSRDLRA